MKQMVKILSLAVLLAIGAAQNNGDVKLVTIDAMVLCTMNFTYDSSISAYNHANCTYFVPGASVGLTDWNQCYSFCCPGLKTPSSTTIDSIATCIKEFEGKPPFATILGIIIGVVFLIIFAIPCCCGKDSLYNNIQTYLAKRAAEEEEEDLNDNIHNSPRYRSKSPKKRESLMTPGSQIVLQQTPNRVGISSKNIDDFPSEQRKCSICKKGRSNLKLKCSHSFHSKCLEGKEKDLNKCIQCMSESIFPIAAYCSICERRYSQFGSVNLQNTYICKVCEEK